MINLPAAGYRPRAFGEEDFAGGPCQGTTIVTVKGKEANVRFKTVTQEEFTYPWTINDGGPYPYSIYFNDLQLVPAPSDAVASRAGGTAVGLKPDEETWWLNKYLPFDHIAGEHRYIFATKKMGPDPRQP